MVSSFLRHFAAFSVAAVLTTGVRSTSVREDLLNDQVQKEEDCLIHTWHNITAYKGTWEATISDISEVGNFYKGDCTKMEAMESFTVTANGPPAKFGYLPGPNDTFDAAYALTLVRTSAEPSSTKKQNSTVSTEPDDSIVSQASRRLLFKSMSCVYVIAAAGAAMPDVRDEPFNGATCMWERVEGVGENYFVDFAEDN